jgi:hypothetical protein
MLIDVSDEHIASVFRVEMKGEAGFSKTCATIYENTR